MSKYELAVVVSAKLEDDARAEVIEKVKALVTRFGGNITELNGAEYMGRTMVVKEARPRA